MLHLLVALAASAHRYQVLWVRTYRIATGHIACQARFPNFLSCWRAGEFFLSSHFPELANPVHTIMQLPLSVQQRALLISSSSANFVDSMLWLLPSMKRTDKLSMASEKRCSGGRPLSCNIAGGSRRVCSWRTNHATPKVISSMDRSSLTPWAERGNKESSISPHW